MAERFSNDNGAPTRHPAGFEPDPHGRAALLLVESVLHGLIERLVITVEQAVKIVEIAAEAKDEIGLDTGDTPLTLARSLSLLASISESLKIDLGAK